MFWYKVTHFLLQIKERGLKKSHFLVLLQRERKMKRLAVNKAIS
ncbi:hypothetical protein HMPREF6745_0879 [Prevotella sp. oral taxon 472 str. F0295]|nr:hypothetical protein HMPREF6745_0879 [Prevotella sp. oral taxon 472 str. F0295]